MIRLSLIVAVLLFSTHVATATDAVRQHGSHEHGTAQLDVAVEADELQIRLDTPAVNILGFEHEPRTTEQKRKLEHAIEILNDGKSLFSVTSDARCWDQVHIEVVSPFLMKKKSHDHDHDHHHGHGHSDEDSHSDIVASWHFKCMRAEVIEDIRTRLFDRFPQLQRLKVQYITTDSQGGTMLTPENPVITF